MNNEWLKKKKILITNLWLENYSGSELNCLSIAKEFIRRGANVEIATLDYGEPICHEFERENIKVTIIPHQKLSSSHYDLVWAYHSIVLNMVLFVEKITADKIVFGSLGPKEPFEAAPIYADDLTQCISVSKETLNVMLYNSQVKNCIVFAECSRQL